MNKKIIRSVLATIIIAGSTYFTAFATMASGSVVIGNQAASLDYANDPTHAAEITKDIVSGGAIYVKDFEGNWIDNITGKTVNASIIPAVVYKSDGKSINYDAQDKDQVANQVSTLAVGSVSAINQTENIGNSYTLPENVIATLADNSTKRLSVIWDKQADTKVAGNFTYIGTLTMASGIINPNNVTITAKLTVLENTTATSGLTAKQIINSYGNAVVYVEVSDKNHNVTASGSGFIVKSTGVVVTNFHVIKGASYASVTVQNGSEYDVKSVLNYNVKQDIAVLKLSNATNLSTVNLGDSDKVQVGDNVAAIGSPQGYANTLSTGIISGINRKNDRGDDIQTTASITYGSSGGALFDAQGNVIGITYSGFDSAGEIGFVIPINEVKPFLATTNEKTLQQINSILTIPVEFLPQLSDVPQPVGINYDDYVVNSDESYVEYFYTMSDTDFTTYDKLLIADGWVKSKTGFDEDNKVISYYSKGDNTISIGWIGADRTILGAIH